MNFIATLLWPIKWVIELLLVAFHSLWTALGINPDSGGVWVLSISTLVVAVRTALLPLALRQARDQRALANLAPAIRGIQDKFVGQKDPASRAALNSELMALYAEHRISPIAGSLPLFIQLPIFLALFSVLHEAATSAQAGVGLLSSDLAESFAGAEFLGAPLSASLAQALLGEYPSAASNIFILSLTITTVAVAAQVAKQVSARKGFAFLFPSSKQGHNRLRLAMAALPLGIVVSGFIFPIAILFYLLTSTVWGWGLQLIINRRYASPEDPESRLSVDH